MNLVAHLPDYVAHNHMVIRKVNLYFTIKITTYMTVQLTNLHT